MPKSERIVEVIIDQDKLEYIRSKFRSIPNWPNIADNLSTIISPIFYEEE